MTHLPAPPQRQTLLFSATQVKNPTWCYRLPAFRCERIRGRVRVSLSLGRGSAGFQSRFGASRRTCLWAACPESSAVWCRLSTPAPSTSLCGTFRRLPVSRPQTRKMSDLARLALSHPEYAAVNEKAEFATPRNLEQRYCAAARAFRVRSLVPAAGRRPQSLQCFVPPEGTNLGHKRRPGASWA